MLFNQDNAIAVEVSNVSKYYKIYDSHTDRLLETLSFGLRKKHSDFCALNKVSFSIKKGKTTGIVGRNGSGKSTILKIISSLLNPTTGSVKVMGKVAALLELGTGFNPEFTGNQNIRVNCTLMGLTKKQIQNRIPAIEAFADIGEFINHPFKTYSSGMRMRLAFATAIHVDPDILIVDEAMAVGDARFQQRCYKKFDDFQREGKTIILVTHDMHAIPRYCDEAILLDKGAIVAQGKPKKIVRLYNELLLMGKIQAANSVFVADMEQEKPVLKRKNAFHSFSEKSEEIIHKFIKNSDVHSNMEQLPFYNRNEYRFGDGSAKIIDVLVRTEDGFNQAVLTRPQVIDIFMKVYFSEAKASPVIGLSLKSVEGVMIHGNNSRLRMTLLPPVESDTIRVYKLSLNMNLHDGDWFVDLGVAEHIDMIDRPSDIRAAVLHFMMSQGSLYDGITDLNFSVLDLKKNQHSNV